MADAVKTGPEGRRVHLEPQGTLHRTQCGGGAFEGLLRTRVLPLTRPLRSAGKERIQVAGSGGPASHAMHNLALNETRTQGNGPTLSFAQHGRRTKFDIASIYEVAQTCA